jgi:hypothetical protein
MYNLPEVTAKKKWSFNGGGLLLEVGVGTGLRIAVVQWQSLEKFCALYWLPCHQWSKKWSLCNLGVLIPFTKQLRLLNNFCLAWGLGDPHINTLDAGNYTFNGWGEYILSKFGDFEFQGRTAAVNESVTGSATQFSTLAFGVTDAIIEV